MVSPTPVAPGLAVLPQIRPEDVDDLARQGYRAIVCNRPDGEDAGQPAAAEIAEAARRAGLEFAHLPITANTWSKSVVEEFARLTADPSRPVAAYCRTGTRCYTAWAVGEVLNGRAEAGPLVIEAAGKGYDLASLPMLAQRLSAG